MIRIGIVADLFRIRRRVLLQVEKVNLLSRFAVNTIIEKSTSSMNITSLGIASSSDPKLKQWLESCYLYANNSIHPSTHNAAMIIRDDQIILEGVNNLPSGVLPKEERFTGEKKHIFLNHAERDVIYKAARTGISTLGLTMVMPWLPCIPCANAIISSGILQLVVHKQMLQRTKDKWHDELCSGVEIMKEAGIKLIAYDGLVGVKAFMHGNVWDA